MSHFLFLFIQKIIMKKKTLLLTLPVLLILWWCFGSQSTDQSEDNALSWTTAMETTQPTLEQCQTAVSNYLESQKDVSIDSSTTVQSGNTIVVDYIGRLANGEVFDTSVESVARECGLYNEARNYSEGLEFVAGAGNVVAGFDEGVMGMALNETKTIEMTSDKAYGGETVVYPKWSDFPTKEDGSEYKAGDSIPTMMGMIEIIEITDTEVTVKNAHPLANKDLIFDVTLKAIK